MPMEIADRLKTDFIRTADKTKRILIFIFLLCFACLSIISAQTPNVTNQIGQAQIEFDNGNYAKAVEIAEIAVNKARNHQSNLLVVKGLDVMARSQISLQNYNQAQSSLDEALLILADSEADAVQKAQILMQFAWLQRSQRKFSEAFEFGKKALALVPRNRQIQGEYFLNGGRILFACGYDISAVVWLEKAEKMLESEKINAPKLDTYRFLALAWASKLNYRTALRYSDKLLSSSENTQFKYKYRQALFESATNFSATGQEQKAFAALEKGLKSSLEQNHSSHICIFLNSLLLNSLAVNDVTNARGYLTQLEEYDVGNQFSFEKTLGKAIVAAFTNQTETAENLFSQLDKTENPSAFMLLHWKIRVAERKKDWSQVLKLNQKLLELTLENNFRDDLPAIHLDFAKVYFNLAQIEKSSEHLKKSLAFVEEIRHSENDELSLGILETYHDAYRLLTQIKLEKPEGAFESADLLKARLLKDRIDNAEINYQPIISPTLRQTLEELSLKYLDDQAAAAEIERQEKLVTNQIPQIDPAQTDLSGLGKIHDFVDSAVVSYFFTLDKKLIAFVREKDQPARIVNLPVAEAEADALAKTTGQKIKKFIFFKRDGREIYDRLIKPLNLGAKHLIIVPDKSLWKIPFQALSSDGEKYLIEEKLITYAPSVSILLEQLKNPKPERRILQAFANPSGNDQFLQFATAEAAQVAAIYNSKPIQNATVGDFERNSKAADILHFSMHAQVDSEQPLESFLSFKKDGATDDGHLSVRDLLKIKLKKGSLAFLASCDTNNVLNAEGLVSLAWGIMGSGATTVISAGWEANDKSTAVFSKSFYTFYKQGNSSAEAIQKASLELIKNKSNNLHEPYYWANFTLNGDFR